MTSSAGRSTRRPAAPRVSILMTVRDAAPYLPAAMDGLLGQTVKELELIAVDDGSSDDSGRILDGYAARDPRIVVIHTAQQLGIPRAANCGLQHCRAGLVARADADDLYAPDRIARQLAFLAANPAVGLLGSCFHRIGSDGGRIDTVSVPGDDATIRARQLFSNSFLQSATMFRTTLVREVGGYDPRYWTAEDSDLWSRLRDRTAFANLPDPLVSYRLHPHSNTRTRGEGGRRLSLTVPQRLMAAMLGRSLDTREVAAAVGLYQGFEPLDAPTVRHGLPLLLEILDHIGQEAPASAVRFLRREAASSLVRQAEHHIWSNRILARRLMIEAMRLDPSKLADWPVLLRGARALIPRRSGARRELIP